MANIAALKAKNAQRWADMHIHADRLAEFDRAAREYCKPENKARFQAVTKRLVELGYQPVPWWFIAVVAEREYGRRNDGSLRWDRQLGQGDRLDLVSHNEPAGRGPFLDHEGDTINNNAWLRCCLDALINCGPFAAKWTDWSPGGVLTLWEEYNGLGYANMGVPSAYVFSGTDQYVSGKYVADHVYRASAVDVQEGCAPLLARMMAIDSSIVFSPVNHDQKEQHMPDPATSTTPGPVLASPQPHLHLDFSKIETTVETIAKVLPFVSMFIPPPYNGAVNIGVQVLEGILKLAADVQDSGGDSTKMATAVAVNLHSIASQVEKLFNLPNLHLPGIDPAKAGDLLSRLAALQPQPGQNQASSGG